MIRYYCSGFDINNAFGHGLGEMFNQELIERKNLLFIPCGKKGYDKNIKKGLSDSFIKHFATVGINFENNYVLNPYEDQDKAPSLIDNANFIIMMGGDPICLDEMLEELNVKENLKKFNGILLGYSAGAMMMSKYIIITPCSDEYPDFVIKEGLNLDGISIYPHNNTKEEEYPKILTIDGETYKREDLIYVAQKYGEYYLLQDYFNGENWDISIIKSNNGEIEYYTENNGRIWIAGKDITMADKNVQNQIRK